MDAASVLREARRRAGLTQRALGEAAGVAQPMIARIERATTSPRVDTLDRLLRACGQTLDARPVYGQGVDRSVIDLLLDLTPLERLRRAADEANALDRLLTKVTR